MLKQIARVFEPKHFQPTERERTEISDDEEKPELLVEVCTG